MYRKAAVAGYFYPSDKEELADFIEKYRYRGSEESCVMAVVPHAGYVYSGAIAVRTLSRLKLSDTVIILGTNHSGFGETISVWNKGAWQTPFGDVPIDENLAGEIIKNSFAEADILAHIREHSIETALPILKYLKPDIKIVPVEVMGMNMSRLKAFARDLVPFMGKDGNTLIVSSDMNHYEDKETTDKKDNLAIEQILAVDGEGLYERVLEHSVSMCGIYPAAAALMAAQTVGARGGVLVERATSASVSGDREHVVGYAGIIIGCDKLEGDFHAG